MKADSKKWLPRLSGSLDEQQAKLVLREYGIPVVHECVAADAAEAVAAARRTGFPVAVKGLGTRLLHKTERGLVKLNLADADAVVRAARCIAESAGPDLDGYLVQPMVAGCREFMAGMFRDPQFGPVILFGVGGILAEALDDTVLRLAPLNRRQALGMVSEIRSKRLLGAFRGEAAVRLSALADALTGLSRLAAEHTEVNEIDINPLRSTPDGAVVALDALISCRESQDAEPVQNFPPPVPPEEIGALFHPRSIAFIGASRRLGKWGHLLPVNTLSGGYRGEIFLVNPQGGIIAGRPVHKSIADLPQSPDLAVVTLPASKVRDLFPQCRAKGIRRILLITSGFSETGPEGRILEHEMAAAASREGLVVLGPNTMGIANPHINLYLTGVGVRPHAGGTSMVAQSGNLGTQLLAFAEKQGIGIRLFAGSGNEAMITIEDYLDALEVDDKTTTILLYVESVKNGRRFFENAARVSRKKPIVLLKGGQTSAGGKAAVTHTGALASDRRVFDAMCRQAGIVKVEKPTELLDLAAAFAALPLPRGPRVAIMTWGGGWGVVTCDLCERYGLQVPELEPRLIAQIDKILPSYWSRTNPVDMVGESDLSIPMTILDLLMRWDGCDAVINLGIMGRRLFARRLSDAVIAVDPGVDSGLMSTAGLAIEQFEKEFVDRSARLMTACGKPVIGVSFLTDEQDQIVRPAPPSPHQPVFYASPERAVNALAKLAHYHLFRSERD